eukprot:8921691-Pyramimonas_sp.AAC.1
MSGDCGLLYTAAIGGAIQTSRIVFFQPMATKHCRWGSTQSPCSPNPIAVNRRLRHALDPTPRLLQREKRHL